MGRRLSPRFGMEVTILVLVTVLLILLEVASTTGVAVIFVVWLAIAALELLAPRRHEEPAAGEGAPEPEAVPAEPVAEARPLAGAEPFAPEPLDAGAAPAGAREAERSEAVQPLAAAPFDEAAKEPAPPRPALAAAPVPQNEDQGAHERVAEEEAGR